MRNIDLFLKLRRHVKFKRKKHSHKNKRCLFIGSRLSGACFSFSYYYVSLLHIPEKQIYQFKMDCCHFSTLMFSWVCRKEYDEYWVNPIFSLSGLLFLTKCKKKILCRGADFLEKQAFLLILHKKSDSLKDLLKILEDANGDVFIHIDSKSKDKSLEKLIKSYSNTLILKRRFNISWGGFNMIKAMMELLQVAFKKSKNYTHYVFLSGNDYPVFNGKKINEFFSDKKGRELMNAYSITNSNCKHCYSKITKIFFMDNITNSKIISKIYEYLMSELYRRKRKMPFVNINGKNEDVFYGSQWFALTENCVNYVLKMAKDQQLNNYFSHSFAPDEMFFHTIVFNSKFCLKNLKGGTSPYNNKWNLFNYTFLDSSMLSCGKEIESSKIRAKITYLKNYKKNKKLYQNTGSGSINFLDESFFEEIIKSNFPFCRKVDDKFSKKLIEKLRKVNGLA